MSRLIRHSIRCIALVATAFICASGPAILQASQSVAPLVEPVTSLQDALAPGEFADPVSADPIHPWDNNGFSDTTDLSQLGRRWLQQKRLSQEAKPAIRPEVRKAAPSATLPERIESVRNYPNPFNAQTRIEFALAQGGKASLEIFNLLGQTQNRVEWNHLEAGAHSWLWQGVSYDGRNLPSGVYFYRIEVEQSSAIGKMVLLK